MDRFLSSQLLPLITLVVFSGLASCEDSYVQSWNAHRFSPESRSGLLEHLHLSVDAGLVPGGAMLLIHEGETVFKQAFGYSHLQREVPFRAEGHFRAASISKSIIATLIVKLAADGILGLDQPIDELLPIAKELRLTSGRSPTRIPTLRECLHHSAGFRADASPERKPWLQWRHQSLTLADVVERESLIPLSQNPGKKYAYSGIGYDFAGRVVEVVTNRSIEVVLQEHLCKPLGMLDTTFYPSADVYSQLPSFYWRHRSDGKLVRERDKPYSPSGEYVSIGGGIVTTLDDLGRFMLVHQNGGRVGEQRWIDPSKLEEMYLRKRPGSFYGLGFVLGPADERGHGRWILHTGSSGTMVWCDRTRNVIGVIATQHRYSDGGPMPESERKIPRDALSWGKQTKTEFIDPIFGWDR